MNIKDIKLFNNRIPAVLYLLFIVGISFIFFIFIDGIFFKITSLIVAGIIVRKLYIQYVYCLRAFEEAIKTLKENPTNYAGAKGFFGNKKFKYHKCPFHDMPDPFIDILNVLTIHYGDKVLQDKKKSVEQFEEIVGKVYIEKTKKEKDYKKKDKYYKRHWVKKSDIDVETKVKNKIKEIWNSESLWQIKHSFNEKQIVEVETTLTKKTE